MVSIRLTRHGAKKRPFYRVIAADSRSRRDGKHIEVLGYYDPGFEPEVIVIKEERFAYWQSVGAQPSDTVRSLVKRIRRRAAAGPQS